MGERNLEYLKKIGKGAASEEAPNSSQIATELAQMQAEGKDLETPFRNRKLHPWKTKMPIGFWNPEEKKFYKGFRVKQLSADALVNLNEEETNMFKVFGQIIAKGLEDIFETNDKGDELGSAPNWRSRTSKLFLNDCMFLMTEIMCQTKGSTLVTTNYRCPQCKKFTKFENEPAAGISPSQEKGFDLLADEDTMSSLDMEDIYMVPCKDHEDLVPEFEITFDQDYTVDGHTIRKIRMRIPEIGDYLPKGNRHNGNNRMIERDVFLDCLIGVEGLTQDQFRKLKLNSGVGIFNISAPDYNKITSKINSWGYMFGAHKTQCRHCSYEYETSFDYSNFFASVLKTKS